MSRDPRDRVLEALLGPGEARLVTGVRIEREPGRVRLVTDRDLEGLATGRFACPSACIAFDPSRAEAAANARFGGYSWTQFCLPVESDAALAFRFDHGRSLVSPPVAFPFFARHAEHGALLLAPLDAFHEQVLAVVDGTLQWGFNGHLDFVPEGFQIELGVFAGASIRDLLAEWGRLLRERSRVAGADRRADVSTSHLSYWTDNGAAYWYRREPGEDLVATLERKATELRECSIPVRAVELDSWFYPHETTREVMEVGYLDEVPPTGMLRWEPREDILQEGVEGLRARLGDPPLILHSRHVSALSPYVENEGDWWVHHGQALPRDPVFFDRWMSDAARWGATCYEQDWLWVIYFGMEPMRARAGQTRVWLQGLHDAADRHGLSLIFCMATPADFAEATRLPRVVAVRTCDDYRYAEDPAFLWTWYLGVNALARGLGLWPFKDVFFSARGEGIDGDPWPEVEALLSALSGGPVGIGDRIGRSDPDVIARTCRADGLLVKPDAPISAMDHCLFGSAKRGETLLWADTHSGETRYVLALNTTKEKRTVGDRLDLAGTFLVYDWRQQTALPANVLEAELAPRDWAYWVVCPIEDGRALIGDPSRYATRGDGRFATTDDGRLEAIGTPGEGFLVRRWSEGAGIEDRSITIPGDGRVRLD